MSQIFKEPIPNELLFSLLERISGKEGDCFLVDYIAFKKGMYHGWVEAFIHACFPYYYISKRRKYLERTVTYPSFITVLRQICKANAITYTTTMKYAQSDYDIVYYVKAE